MSPPALWFIKPFLFSCFFVFFYVASIILLGLESKIYFLECFIVGTYRERTMVTHSFGFHVHFLTINHMFAFCLKTEQKKRIVRKNVVFRNDKRRV